MNKQYRTAGTKRWMLYDCIPWIITNKCSMCTSTMFTSVSTPTVHVRVAQIWIRLNSKTKHLGVICSDELPQYTSTASVTYVCSFPMLIVYRLGPATLTITDNYSSCHNRRFMTKTHTAIQVHKVTRALQSHRCDKSVCRSHITCTQWITAP